MQTYKDSVSGKLYAFEDDVIVTETNGTYTFVSAHNVPLNVPDTLQPYVTPAPTAAQLLSEAQAAQTATLYQSYIAAISQPVAYTSVAGVAETYQADVRSVTNLNNLLSAYRSAGVTPAGFYWVAADNTHVPFSYADLDGLAVAMAAQGWAAFEHLQARKTQLLAQTMTVAQASTIQW